jgi:hypothetical protein
MRTRLALGLAASLIVILQGGAPARASEHDHRRSLSAGGIAIAIDPPGSTASAAPRSPALSMGSMRSPDARREHDDAPLGSGSRHARRATVEDPRARCGEGPGTARRGADTARAVTVPRARSIRMEASGPACRTGRTISRTGNLGPGRPSASSTSLDRVLGAAAGPGTVISATGGSRQIEPHGATGRSDQVLAEAARSLLTILLIASMVLLFTVFHDRIDRNDPTLAGAPLRADLVRFE